jgi:hypothetical protein
MFLVCIFLVKSSIFRLWPLGFRPIRRYSQDEDSRMTQVSYMEKVSRDPVLSTFELPLRQTFYPLGFPLELESNSPEVIAAAAEGWGAFEPTFAGPPVRLSIGVLEGGGEALPVESVVRSREHMMSIIADPENFVICDYHRGFGYGWVTTNTAADHSLLRYRFLTSAGATLVEHRAFAALHGALVVRNGRGVMLTGDSFAGKSTLAYACARTGWTYVSDDGLFLVRDREDRYVVGDSSSIRFRPDAAELFPELAEHGLTVRPNGKVAIEVRTQQLALDIAPGSHVDHVVNLNREQPVPARVRQFPKELLREQWSQYNAFGTKDVRAARSRCHERMLNAQLWEMRYSNLDEAVARLERLVDQGA